MSSRTFIKTGRKEFDDLVPLVSSFLAKDALEMSIDGKTISGFRTPDAKSIWIRDHVEHFAETQSTSGRIFDYFSTFGWFTTPAVG